MIKISRDFLLINCVCNFLLSMTQRTQLHNKYLLGRIEMRGYSKLISLIVSVPR